MQFQVFHICDNGRKISFLCPNGTIFQQSQLICDWWFKVDCSKSVELYEQSAEQFADEERKRLELKKMNSEFHRDIYDKNNYPDYNGRQNGRSNPYGQSAAHNQIQDQQDRKTQNRHPNQFNNNNNFRSEEKYETDSPREYTTTIYPTTYRQQNQIDNREKFIQYNNLDRGSSKFSGRNSNYLNQGKSSPDADYYSSTANAPKDERQNLRSQKTQSFTRNNFNPPGQRVTPSYTETTTFRVSTANPTREYQEFAESASFGQGARYNQAFSSSNFNTYYNGRVPVKASTSAPFKERLVQPSSSFPGSTFAPIFKPRVVPTTQRTLSTQKSYSSTNYFGPNTPEGNTRAPQTQNQQNTGSTNYFKTTNQPAQFSRSTTPSTVGTKTTNVADRYSPKLTSSPNSAQATSVQQNSTPSVTRQNLVAASTEKPARSTQSDSRTVPYNRNSSNQGKLTATTSFTKNYVPSSTVSPPTPRSPVYTATVPSYRDKLDTPKNSPTTNGATYLPKKTTIPVGTTYTTPKPIDGRPLNEREHALSMLQSLQGLEGAVPTLVNARGGNRPGLNIPTSSGPSALHSLALYFASAANASNNANIDYPNDDETVVQKKENASTDLPTSILTQHTINSYVELFNLNNALEFNGTALGESDEDEDYSDLELQQSAGPLNGGRKSNGTKLRELAQVFTQALSAYLQDPETFKKVLTDIRPTEPPDSNEQFESSTVSSTTTEEYPSVTKEKDEVLDFSDDVAGSRRRHPLTTIYPDTTHRPFYTTEYYSSFATDSETYPTSTQNSQDESNNIAYDVNNAFDSTNADYRTRSTANYNENYFSVDSNRESRNNTEPYGKNVKPYDATPISDNYVASSTPESYGETETPAPVGNEVQVDQLQQDLVPPSYRGRTDSYPTDATTEVTTATPVYRNDQEATTTEPFRVNYYDTTQINQESRTKPKDESLVPANSVHGFGNSFRNDRQNVPTSDSQQINNHWTSSPSVTQLWESTVFLDPQRINQGLATDPTVKPAFAKGLEYRTTFPTDVTNSVTSRTYPQETSTWQWPATTDDAPTAFTLLPNAHSPEHTATPNPPKDSSPQKFTLLNVTENEISKAHEMFGNLNETSSNKLMKVMKQADKNVTVRQLVLLLISHCDGPMNKTMEEEKEELLSALLRLPVHEFSSAESTEIIKGISRISLPLGRSRTQPSTAPTEPSVTTYRSRKNRRYKPTTERSTSRRRTAEVRESRNSVAEEGDNVSDARALELLRSLYSIAAKWG